MLAAILGAGPVADAFFVALRLPNHFRAIFAEGAFNAAFVPAYARIRETDGAEPSKLFADRVFTLLLAVQLVLLAAGAGVHARRDRAAGAGLQRGSGALCAGDRAHPHHVSLSAADQPGDALRRHPQRAGPLRVAGRRADPAQPVDDDGAGACRVLSDRRPCRGVGRADRRRAGGARWSAAMPGGRARCRNCAGRGSIWR